MSRTIHGLSHQGLKAFRKKSAALPVYWIYLSRMNNEGVAWPSARGLAKDTGWNKATCLEARDYLIEIKALEVVKDYVRPDWRDKPAQEKTRKINFDRSEYYRPTGYIMIADKKFKMLYNGSDEASSIDENASDVLQNRTSAQTGHPPTPDIQFGSTELNSPIDLDSSKSDLDSSKDTAPFGAGLETPDPISLVENPKPTNGTNPSKELPANTGAAIPPQSSAKIPPAVSRWNDVQLNAYYVENKADIDLIAAARGVDHERVPFKNCLVGDRRETVKLHISILARQLAVAEYIKFLREKHFSWRKKFCVSLKEMASTIAVYESQLYPLKEVLDIPTSTPEEIAQGFKTFAESQSSLLGKGIAS